jgi:integrase/recombinase XerD
MSRAKTTIAKRKECIQIFKNVFGNINIKKIKLEHFDEVKRIYFERGCGRSRVASIIYSLKSFLRYCRDVRGYKMIEVEKIKAPAQEKYRVVITLNKEEIHKIMESIKMMNEWQGKKRRKNTNLHGLRWKCLLECLWSSGMRISEALSLNRNTIDLENREAIICGKGNKHRKVFFSEEAIRLVREYLMERHDDHEALFVTHCQARRWSFSAAQNYLERWRVDLDISKRLTFHTFRRTFASFIFYEKDIYTASKLLGHADIETTRRHYISEDWNKLREIHRTAIECISK